MPIADEQWQVREAFLLEVRDLQNQIWGYAERGKEIREFCAKQSDSLKMIENLPEKELELVQANTDTAKARAKRLMDLRGDTYRLASDISGRGVRQGSLYPPTAMHRIRKSHIETAIKKELEGLTEMKSWHVITNKM